MVLDALTVAFVRHRVGDCAFYALVSDDGDWYRICGECTTRDLQKCEIRGVQVERPTGPGVRVAADRMEHECVWCWNKIRDYAEEEVLCSTPPTS